ncbi:MAG: glycerol-3-phosphate 1-O-acyltransferase PlsY [Lachnospiraceae bacterium]|nr:glycerol-3-phosphate 1-O-acyltransferase PlsY [Lachnospiraceae bacterium]
MPFKIASCIIVGYLCGSISTGYLVGRLHHFDIRNYGSGNAGATNATRTLGKKAGLLVLLCDLLKVMIPASIVHYGIFAGEDYATLLCEITGFAGVLGHNYPVWLHFKGGKGIASTGGAMLATDFWIAAFIPVFIAIVAITKYVSLGSMFVVFLYPVFLGITRYGDPYYLPMLIIACLFTASGVFTHRKNIQRLLNGTERKFGQKVEVPAEAVIATEKETQA